MNSSTDFELIGGCSQFQLSHDEKDQDGDCDDKGGGDDDDNGNGDDDDDNADKTSDDVCWSPSLSLHTSLNRAPQKQTTHKGLIVSVTKMILTSCYSRSGEIVMIGLIIIVELYAAQSGEEQYNYNQVQVHMYKLKRLRVTIKYVMLIRIIMIMVLFSWPGAAAYSRSMAR